MRPVTVQDIQERIADIERLRQKAQTQLPDMTITEAINAGFEDKKLLGQSKCCYIMLKQLEAGATYVNALLGVMDKLAEGADDEWSGRGNDLKRVEHDGFRYEARRFLDRADRS